MERVEETMSALIPALESHEIGAWDPSQVDLLCSMLREYGSQARASTARKSTHRTHTPNPGEDEEEEEEEEEVDEEALFVEAVSEVDRGLGRTREFLKSRLSYGVQPEPTHIPGSEVAAASYLNKKRPRSPDDSKTQVEIANGQMPSTSVMPAPVYAVDSFLYSEDDIEELVKAKHITREYCTRCGCTSIGLCEFITHSFSQDQLLYLSCFLLPHVLRQVTSAAARAERGKETAPSLSIVDVGSRLGVVLWACAFALQQGALVQPPSGDDEDEKEDEAEEPEVHITGVEIDEAYMKLSQDVLRRFFLPRRRRAPRLDCADSNYDINAIEAMDVSPRLHLVQSNCFDGAGAEALSRASVVVLHNVFEYFSASPVEHAKCWLKLRRLACHTGKFLVCSPALEETLSGFTAEVWAAAWAAESGGQAGAAVAPLSWQSSFVERVDVSVVANNFLAMRALSCEDGDGGGCCEGDSCCEEGCCHGSQNADNHSRDDKDAGDAAGSCVDGEAGGEDSDVEEQIRKIYVYRVL
ncbi:hypothetical protein ABL78_7066 [Leptomonas seymouri]|uniref:Uncharacterized protein n=1 Tax=Leptomonas seymouri TaxID=5684 RepID=A0A0N1I161_LEPSE|nr:hypothetical protein ABL78_7066 [Leptomonas seymouri]|eukprot:KPI83888.1 hypothetical protein ABL78_7066 [Leptomonas seymouri]